MPNAADAARRSILVLACLLVAGCSSGPEGLMTPLAPGATLRQSALAEVSDEYELVDIGASIVGHGRSRARGVSASEVVVGGTADLYFRWSAANGVDFMRLPDGRNFFADDLNDRGDIIGETTDTGGQLWMRWADGRFEQLDIPAPTAGRLYISGQRINERAEVAGVYQAGSQMTAFFWSPASGYQAIHSACLAAPFGLSEAGTVVGHVSECGGAADQVFRWSAEGGYEPLQALGGIAASLTGVNSDGDMAGGITYAGGRRDAVLVHADLSVQRLDNPFGGTVATASDVNDRGEIVGSATPAGGLPQAMVWERDGSARPLPPFGRSALAVHVSSNGIIVGFGTPLSGPLHALLWRPLPPVVVLAQASGLVEEHVAAGRLSAGEGASLNASLDAATARIAAAQPAVAVNQLEAMLHKVNALVRSRRLGEADAAPLAGKVRRVVRRLED